MSPRCALVVLVVLAAAAALAAQERPKDRDALLQALGSGDAREVAWAAHFAREAGHKALAAPLVDALARWRTDESAPGRDVCLHLLDALLGIAAPVPADAALPLLDDGTCGVAAFALLARAPQHNEASLLARFRTDVAALAADSALSPRLVAIGSLLAAQRTPGFAALVADRIERNVRIAVRDAGPRSIHGSATFRPAAPRPAGWPALPEYSFAEESTRLLMGNWRPIELPEAVRGAVLRLEPGTAETLAWLRNPWTPPKSIPALAWLCTLAGERAPPAVLEHGFDGAARFTAVATAARDERRELLRRVREELVAKALLTADEARPLAGPVEVEVLDRRKDTSVELPAIPAAR